MQLDATLLQLSRLATAADLPWLTPAAVHDGPTLVAWLNRMVVACGGGSAAGAAAGVPSDSVREACAMVIALLDGVVDVDGSLEQRAALRREAASLMARTGKSNAAAADDEL